MKKQVVIIGIIALLVSVGLSGCTQNTSTNNNNENSNINYITVSELQLHSPRYIGNTTTVKAIFEQKLKYYYDENDIDYFVISDKISWQMTESSYIGIEIPDGVNTSLLMLGETYYVTGIPGYGDFIAFNKSGNVPRSGLFMSVESIDLYYNFDSNTTPTIKQIGEHPPSFFFRTITVKGQETSRLSQITSGTVKYTMDIDLSHVDYSTLIPNAEYYYTGVVRRLSPYRYIPAYNNAYWNGIPQHLNGISFVVEKIEPA
jgi:hypothetical protein